MLSRGQWISSAPPEAPGTPTPAAWGGGGGAGRAHHPALPQPQPQALPFRAELVAACKLAKSNVETHSSRVRCPALPSGYIKVFPSPPASPWDPPGKYLPLKPHRQTPW